jgi:formylmethanofuran dehydrogenase subunit A
MGNIGDEEQSLMDDDNNEIVITPVNNGMQYVAKCYVAAGGEFDLLEKPTSYNDCKKVCEDYAQKHMALKYADKNGPWMQAAQLTRATEGQLRTLGERNGARNNMTMASASLAIRRMTALKRKREQSRIDDPITVQQKFYLDMRGVDSSGMTKRTAMRAISEHKQWENSFGRRR